MASPRYAPWASPAGSPDAPLVLTIGHSTRTIECFIGLLEAHQADGLVDVRTLPRSRRHPHFDLEPLARSLERLGLTYRHARGLGGLRRPLPDSINSGWRNAAFRGYADHMGTPEFEREVRELAELAAGRRIAVMCAEAVPWRCHRSLLADALLVRGLRVEHILGTSHREVHRFTPWARVEENRIIYPAHGPTLDI